MRHSRRDVLLLFAARRIWLFAYGALSVVLVLYLVELSRRRTLLLGTLLVAGLAFLLTDQPLGLIIAAIIGVISPSGNEIGPFLSIEQAALAQLLTKSPILPAHWERRCRRC